MCVFTEVIKPKSKEKRIIKFFCCDCEELGFYLKIHFKDSMLRLVFLAFVLIFTSSISAAGSVTQLHIYVNNIAPLSNPSETYKYYTLPFI